MDGKGSDCDSLIELHDHRFCILGPRILRIGRLKVMPVATSGRISDEKRSLLVWTVPLLRLIDFVRVIPNRHFEYQEGNIRQKVDL